MKFCYPVDSKNIVKAAMRLIQSAKKEIVATMDVDEEVRHPLPQAYHRLLIKKAHTGVRIVRYGFGSRRAFHRLNKQFNGIEFIYSGLKANYQRMLVVDQEVGIFRVGDTVYKTKFQPFIHALVAYTKNSYNKEEL